MKGTIRGIYSPERVFVETRQGHLLGAGVHDSLRKPPALLVLLGLDVAAQAGLYEAHHNSGW
jgi:hypothetical protein